MFHDNFSNNVREAIKTIDSLTKEQQNEFIEKLKENGFKPSFLTIRKIKNFLNKHEKYLYVTEHYYAGKIMECLKSLAP